MNKKNVDEQNMEAGKGSSTSSDESAGNLETYIIEYQGDILEQIKVHLQNAGLVEVHKREKAVHPHYVCFDYANLVVARIQGVEQSSMLEKLAKEYRSSEHERVRVYIPKEFRKM
ncbi:hypothetical protein JW868_00270 [Candidatus Woesearchaeota archaeon]|nr:hypothetical protein [Candidatus Woesearchaeota archaeon]